MAGEACQHFLRGTGVAAGEVWPCHRIDAHLDGWHENHLHQYGNGPELGVDVDLAGIARPAVGALVLRWRNRDDAAGD